MKKNGIKNGLMEGRDRKNGGQKIEDTESEGNEKDRMTEGTNGREKRG